MKFAKSLTDGKLVASDDGTYKLYAEKMLVCPYCKSPVYWRSHSQYKSDDKVINLPSAWVHYQGAEKDCPFYFSTKRNNQNQTVLAQSSQGQREKLILEKFAQIFELAIAVPKLETVSAIAIESLRARCKVPASRFSRPLGDKGLIEANINSFFSLLRDEIYSKRLEILEAIADTPLSTEAFEFLLIDKNSYLLEQLIAYAIADCKANITELSGEQLKLVKTELIEFIKEKFTNANFKEAYLLNHEI